MSSGRWPYLYRTLHFFELLGIRPTVVLDALDQVPRSIAESQARIVRPRRAGHHSAFSSFVQLAHEECAGTQDVVLMLEEDFRLEDFSQATEIARTLMELDARIISVTSLRQPIYREEGVTRDSLYSHICDEYWSGYDFGACVATRHWSLNPFFMRPIMSPSALDALDAELTGSPSPYIEEQLGGFLARQGLLPVVAHPATRLYAHHFGRLSTTAFRKSNLSSLPLKGQLLALPAVEVLVEVSRPLRK